MEKTRTTSVSQAAWVLGVFLLAWPAFLFLDLRTKFEQDPLKQPPRSAPLPTLSSKLVAVGLPADPDLEALPPFFALWADRAKWENGKTRFAYRHPVTGEFSFYFEATRTPAGYRFREIPKPIDPAGRMVWSEDLGEDCPFKYWITDPGFRHLAVRDRSQTQREGGRVRIESEVRVEVVAPSPKLEVPITAPDLKPLTDEKKPTR